MAEWSYRRDSIEVGPLTLDSLRLAITDGRLSAADFVRHGDGTWMPAGASAELMGMFGTPPPLPPTSVISDTRVVSKPIWPWLVGAGVTAFVILSVLLAIAGLAGSQSDDVVLATTAVPVPRNETASTPIGPLIDINGVDATPELGRIVSQMNDQQKLAIGIYNATTGLDFYAARVRVTNSGDQACFITPNNIRLHLYGETVGVVPMKDVRFLQPTMLMPDHYIEGLVVYLATVHAGAAMRLGEGSISYEFMD